ncbi:SURF1 family protein [Legionella jordanis]|nr:SURF1 family protein [Legionella jordanis]RMX05247.1 SURF1 family protein [Legionella jordanis]VEH13322.1 Uncharacterized conserved protein [Legionella jordanis]HAT8713670.1 SURF1 family protein [Legionella jordanis]
MLSLTCFNYRFTPNWKMFLLTMCAMFLFTRLGFWQLQRGYEKKDILSAEARLGSVAPVPWNEHSPLPKQGQRILVTGTLLNETFLLDNQFYKHQFGYDILNPLELSSGDVILIDRGWIDGDLTRQKFPEVVIPSGNITLHGSAYFPSAKNWVLGQVIEKKQASLSIIERIETKTISQVLHKNVYPFIIRMGKEQANGYVRDWTVVSMTPQRHYAYAFQWFAMAFVTLVLFVALNLKKTHEHSKA